MKKGKKLGVLLMTFAFISDLAYVASRILE